MASIVDASLDSTLETQGWALIDPVLAKRLEAEAKLVRDVDTHTSGHILSFKGPGESFYVLEEDTTSKERFIRKLTNAQELDEFYSEREEEYQNMWGSCCGGVVKYKERWEKWSMDKFRRDNGIVCKPENAPAL